ncbi:MAG: winged helix-turn-helix domain-containing protein [Steroidobacteraceae bacterium]|jgi:non-specific serine/threonine protein kinase
MNVDSGVLKCAEFELDAVNRRFSRAGIEFPMEPKAFSVIMVLMSRANSLITRDQLLDAVWGHRYVTASTVSRAIALARRAFNDNTDQPQFIQTVHGAGYRFVGRIEERAAAPDETRSHFAPPPTLRVPAQIDALIGREGELTQLADLFGSHRAITILGAGGMGKTQCALEFARRRASAFPDGVWFFDLAPLQEADDWLRTLAIAFNIPPDERTTIFAKIATQLSDRAPLFVIDNCDRLSAGVGAIVLELLRTAPNLKVLATSQQQLNYVGEHVMRMSPLALPHEIDTTQSGLKHIESSPAVALLLARIRAAQPNFMLTASNASNMVEICRQLDGMPLALELAAPRFSLLSAAQILDRLKDRFRFLVSESAGRERRHRNLLVLLDWSFKLLSPQEQRLLMWLSVCVQGLTVETAIDVGRAQGIEPETSVDLLSGLVNKSLLTAETDSSPPRHRLLESVREFALGRLGEVAEEDRARAAHLDSVKSLCRRAHEGMLHGGLREWVAQLAEEHGNIEAAIEYAVTVGDDLLAAQAIVGSLLFYFKARGPHIAALRWTQRALHAGEGTDTRERGRALLCLGVISYYLLLPPAVTERTYREAISILQARADPWSEACARCYYAMWLINLGQAAQAITQFHSAHAIAQKLADPWLEGRVQLTRSWLHFDAAEYDAAITALLPVRRLSADFDQHTFIDIYLGLAHYHIGRHDAAARFCRDALQASIEFGNPRGIAGCLELYAYLSQQAGNYLLSVQLLGVATKVRELTAAPLFRFWIDSHDRAVESLRQQLGMTDYELAHKAGWDTHLEDAANDVMRRLRD